MAKKSKKGHRSPGTPSKDKKKTKDKPKYKVRNWHAYNQELVNRGRLTIWIDPEDVEGRWIVIAPPPSKRKRGHPEQYSDFAIEATLQLGYLFGQSLRQTQGLVEDLFAMLHLPLPVPDFTTLCRRQDRLAVSWTRRAHKEPVHVIIDTTGLKVFGEGEWKVRKHGFSKHRTWRKLHLEILPDGEIRNLALTGNEKSDGQMTQALLEQEPAVINRFTADGGYDTRTVYKVLLKRRVSTITIPPRKNARIWQHGNCKDRPPHPRDEILRTVRRLSSRRRWKEQSGYYVRAKIENTMFRYKTIFGDHLNAHRLDHQQVEATIKAGLLNRMWNRTRPDSYRII